LTKEELLEELQKITFVIKHYCICIEEHQDGNTHLHAYLQFDKKYQTTNSLYFDVLDYHPNVQSTKNHQNVINYIKKDGNFISNLPEKTSAKEKEKAVWTSLITESTSVEDFMARAEQEVPREAVLYNNNLAAFAAKKYKKTIEPYASQYLPEDFDQVPEGLKAWVRDSLGMLF